jgi:hypothetical protein
MKNSPLATVLLVLLACAAIGGLVLCGSYIHITRELRTLQGKVQDINGKQAYMNSLANAALEYSKRNSQIDPILESAGIKPSSGSSTNARPATGASKPTSR